jgi:pyridoxine/pyridoxamine 5'-phosphate oxidase
MDPAKGTLDTQFSSPGVVATQWSAARDRLASAKTYWITTVRPDGRPHSTTIAAVWLDDAVHFTTGESEVKAKNLAANRKVIVTVGCSDWEGLDIVIEGEAVSVTDPDRLTRLAAAFTEKYDDFFGMRVVDDRLGGAGTDHAPLAFEIRPSKAFGFGKAPNFSQTRWLWRSLTNHEKRGARR